MDQIFESSADEIDDGYLFSPFVGVGLFLTGSLDTDLVQATVAELRRRRQEGGLGTLPGRASPTQTSRRDFPYTPGRDEPGRRSIRADRPLG